MPDQPARDPVADPAALRRLLPPDPTGVDLDDDQLLAMIDPGDRAEPRLRVNFVSTLDGSSTADGLSGSLGGPADKRVFDLLRRVSDVVVVGAGTVRDEGYGPMRLDDASVAWRRGRGLPDHPVFALVSATLRLDPGSPVLRDAPVRPVVLTTDQADPEARRALEGVADVVACGRDRVDPRLLREALVARGLRQLHCEGGPTLFGDLVAADEVDELFLTHSPTLEGGVGPRIARSTTGVAGDLRELELAHVLVAGDLLLTRHVRRRTPRA